MTLSEELVARGFIHQVAGGELAEVLDGEKRTIYLGVDPSADSIHAGNFVLFILLRHLADAGHTIIFLSGGGTGMIGDPKPDAERELKALEIVQDNADKISAQARRLLNLTSITFVNNYEWLSAISLLDFLRDIGKHFTVNELIKKDAIATRLSSEVGLSYSEFAYPLLQGYDYLVLNERYGCTVQVGGSDQWGNIVAGVDLIRKKEGKQVFGITTPLVIDKATGKKFGKSEGNAVWLDATKTSVYTFYQFWLNVTDDNVIDYLKRFTLLSLDEIAALETAVAEAPEKRAAQQALARAVTTLVHGADQAAVAERVSEFLFADGDQPVLSADEVVVLTANAPTFTTTVGADLVSVLVESGLASSKREARTFIESGAITLAAAKVAVVERQLIGADFMNGIALLRRGKKQYVVLVLR